MRGGPHHPPHPTPPCNAMHYAQRRQGTAAAHDSDQRWQNITRRGAGVCQHTHTRTHTAAREVASSGEPSVPAQRGPTARAASARTPTRPWPRSARRVAHAAEKARNYHHNVAPNTRVPSLSCRPSSQPETHTAAVTPAPRPQPRTKPLLPHTRAVRGDGDTSLVPGLAAHGVWRTQRTRPVTATTMWRPTHAPSLSTPQLSARNTHGSRHARAQTPATHQAPATAHPCREG